ncbi:MAG: YncE family protein, partial [Bacteroidales bacterium]|nr:YncE family protein [Bacteroidales bacterium]
MMPTLKYPRLIFTLLCLAAALDACRDVDYVIPPTEEDTGAGSGGSGAVSGFYLLNEGNMGSNKASLDFYDFSTGVYMRNIYSDRN